MAALRGGSDLKAVAAAVSKLPAVSGTGLLPARSNQQVEGLFSEVVHYVAALNLAETEL